MAMGKLEHVTRFLRVNLLFARLVALGKDRRGVSAILFALLSPALIGAMGLAAEASYWYCDNRAMQHAADTAAIAAATNGGANYAAEAQAVAAQYGFQNGSGSVTVTVTQPTLAANCTVNCYQVVISQKVPVYLSAVVGYKGTTQANGQPATLVSATSVATQAKAYPYCLLALAGSGAQGITANGVSNANLNHCNTMSNTSARCNGHNLNAAIGDAHQSDGGCGIIQNSNEPVVSDPYAGLASNIPANTCSNYPQEPVKKKDPPLPSQNQWSGTYTEGAVTIACGDQQLTGNTTINNTVLVIENGQLDSNGFTLTGTNLTVIFSGSNSNPYQHIPSGGGTLDIDSPSSGTWSGVAVYQDPALANNVNVSAAGNSPTWNISGLIYLPHASVTLSGAVNKSSHGQLCFELVIDNVTINGTADIFSNDTQCNTQGLSQVWGGRRGQIVA